ncbi:hypothetical protein PPYR_06475 [Photinus pyralis]|uniref:WD repeat-containing protein 63 n=4 Tax=Photinus pyralis TaxID=7054 RepID=A0A5N4ATU9_PHOPY|nr:WD repeat-containing protein 63-like [Photinus pyralis]KAB0800736.1 hypothetical protein PPYR_06475 [Photinus pyralis]
MAEQSLFDMHQYYPETEEQAKIHKRRKVKKQKKETREPVRLDSLNIDGVVKIVMSSHTQLAIQCVVGSDVTAQNAWKYVSRDLLHDYIEQQDGLNTKQFENLKLKIKAFPNPNVLVAYIPSDEDCDEFCITLTLEAEKEVLAHIDAICKDQEEKLNNAINKSIQKWKSRGSEIEVDFQVPKDNRPLLEVEVETAYPIISAKCRFKLRLVEEARDGYVSVVVGRTVSENVVKRRIDECIQAIPAVRSSEAQTVCTYPKNIWTQYDFNAGEVKNLTKAFVRNISHFVDDKLDLFEDMVYLNSSVNLYTSDYSDLVKNVKCVQKRAKKTFAEYTSFFHYEVCKGRTIVDLDWHPMWTGIFVAAYSSRALTSYSKGKPSLDEVDEATFRVAPVLLWSFNDNLSPKLYLEVTREVSALSFCPFHEHLLVGGCINGQLIIWDLTGKLELIESEEILTTKQEGYRKLMHSLIPWMKNISNMKIVRPVVTSNLAYSHSAPVTSIKWISPYREITKSGQLKHIPVEEKRTSLQFISSSQDGTVLAWDLNLHSAEKCAPQVSKRKHTRLKNRPAGLVKNVSPYSVLNRIFKPTFKINVFAPDSTRNLPLAALHLRDLPCHYVEKYPDPHRQFDVTQRLYYEPVLSVSQEPLANQLQFGSMEGDFLTVSWEGFSFNTGEAVNKELGRIEHISKFHDGPIVSLYRSPLYPELILTVGGKIFALWILKFLKEPVFWRTSTHRYTYGLWNTGLPSAFRLTRCDGCVEIWYLKVRSDRYHQEFRVSGGNLGGTFTHPFDLQQSVDAISDYNGSLRLFITTRVISSEMEDERKALVQLCEREVDRKLKIKKWQEDWAVRNAELIKFKKEQISSSQQKKEDVHHKPGLKETEQKHQLEEVKVNVDKWRIKEEKRMQAVLMEKKALDISLLEKQREPLLKILQDKNDKIIKMKDRQHNANDIFNQTVAKVFSDAVEKTAISNIQEDIVTDDVSKDIYQNYLEIEKVNTDIVNKNKYTKPFDWFAMCNAGKERRRALDAHYGSSNHKLRRLRERSGT